MSIPLQHPVETARKLIAETPLSKGGPVVQRWILRDFEKLFSLAARNLSGPFFTGLLNDLAIGYECEPEDILRIPTEGPVIVTANHPFGLVEGPILGAILSALRPDFKFMANSLLGALPQLRDHLIPINPFGDPGAAPANARALRNSIDWLRRGGALVSFPAGEVASIQFPSLKIVDPQWTELVARLAQLTKAPVLPLFFHGSNSTVFHMAGLAHPRLRTALLPREFLNKTGKTIRVSVGSLIRADRLAEIATAGEMTAYIRARTTLLGSRAVRDSASWSETPSLKAKIVAPSDDGLLLEEIKRLPDDRRIVNSGKFHVYLAAAHEIPHTLIEIGRLREITFRQVSEGSGRSIDLAEFDQSYQHLFLWNDAKQEVVGAYRLARTDCILKTRGKRGLYTNTLFHLSPDFLSAIGPAVELGRSFVRSEYQRSCLPLFLLWKGIGHFVAANPQYRTLFGPVSISKEYCFTSKALLVSFCASRRDEQLAVCVRPRKRFSVRPIYDCDFSNLASLLTDVEDLSALISDLEPDRKGVPILLKQYLNLGGQVLDFSVDPNFSNVLDGLVTVDLTRTGTRLLEGYMGKDGSTEFLRYHGIDCLDSRPAISNPSQSPRVEQNAGLSENAISSL